MKWYKYHSLLDKSAAALFPVSLFLVEGEKRHRIEGGGSETGEGNDPHRPFDHPSIMNDLFLWSLVAIPLCKMFATLSCLPCL